MKANSLTLEVITLARRLFEPDSGETFFQWLGSACFFEIAGETFCETRGVSERDLEDAIEVAADLVIREEA